MGRGDFIVKSIGVVEPVGDGLRGTDCKDIGSKILCGGRALTRQRLRHVIKTGSEDSRKYFRARKRWYLVYNR